MKTIKKITARKWLDLTPYTIEKSLGSDNPFYYLEQYGNKTQIHKLQQTAKGVYINLWICRKEVTLFLSNKEIEIEYYD